MRWFYGVAVIFGILEGGLLLFPNRFCVMSTCVGQFLLIGKMIWHGQIPYVDFFDINPPLVMYLHVLPVAIAEALRWRPDLVFNVMVLGLLNWAAFVLFRVSEEKADSVKALSLLVGYYLVTLLAILFSDFGQREHLFFIVMAPHILARTQKDRDVLSRSRLILGFAAGLLSCLKPHFLIAFLLSEFALGRLRFPSSRRLKFFMFGPIVVYCALLLVEHRFLFEVLPAVAPRYSNWGREYKDWCCLGFGHWTIFASLVSFPVLALLSRRIAETPRAWGFVMSLSGFVGAIGLLAANKGFSYHFIPVYGFALMGLALIAVSLKIRFRHAFTTGFFLVCLLPFFIAAARSEGNPFIQSSGRPRFRNNLFALLDRFTKPGDGVYLLSDWFYPNYYVLRDLRWSGRYVSSLFYTYQVHRDPNGKIYFPPYDKLDVSERKFVDTLRADIVDYSPDFYVIVNDRRMRDKNRYLIDPLHFAEAYFDWRSLASSYVPLVRTKEAFVLVKRQREAEARQALGTLTPLLLELNASWPVPIPDPAQAE
jgi:hypothetical protein